MRRWRVGVVTRRTEVWRDCISDSGLKLSPKSQGSGEGTRQIQLLLLLLAEGKGFDGSVGWVES